jgi:hypothetical protein
MNEIADKFKLLFGGRAEEKIKIICEWTIGFPNYIVAFA